MPRICRSHYALLMACVLPAMPLQAFTINVTYDSSTATAPAEFFTAFDSVAQFYQNTLHDPITINLQVGWGKINGQDLAPGSRAQSATFKLPYSYAQIRSALISDAKSAADATAIASLPAANPAALDQWLMARGEAKALGLLAGDDTNKHPTTGLSRPDCYVGFTSTTIYTFDPANRAVAGKYDFIGMAGHEISESIGRFGQGQTGITGYYAPLDLFRYLAPGTRDLAISSGAYFSIDGGNTVISTFNGSGVGDQNDWAGSTLDSYNFAYYEGQQYDFSPGDLVEMDAIGYDAVPEPAGLSLLALPALLARRRATTGPGAWRPYGQADARQLS